jgi:hypothetical protein
MIIVKVVYTVRPEFTSQNQKNIQKVMSDLASLDPSGIRYSTCLSSDGKTFIHIAYFKSPEDRQILNLLPAFKDFQEQLKASLPESQPQVEILSHVGSSFNIF